ncbi:hypothetical protein G9A89_021068 [Geosiphon pyriformis]|nr:hypothetical protein G9A89_021068 [Geosiphon pyriformis]
MDIVNKKAGMVVFFENIDLDLDVSVSGLMFSTLAELQAIVLSLRVSWHKVKGHLDVLGNKCADILADTTSLSKWHLPLQLKEYYILAGNKVVFGSLRHFFHDIFWSMHHACWKAGSGSRFLVNSLLSDVD